MWRRRGRGVGRGLGGRRGLWWVVSGWMWLTVGGRGKEGGVVVVRTWLQDEADAGAFDDESCYVEAERGGA